MWIIFKVFIESVTVLILFYWPRGMWDFSSLTRVGICTPCIGRQSFNHWTACKVPYLFYFFNEYLIYVLILSVFLGKRDLVGVSFYIVFLFSKSFLFIHIYFLF